MLATSPGVTKQLTVGRIADRLGVPAHRVAYILRTRDVHPVSRAGILRVFSEADVALVEGELRRIASDRGQTF